MKAKSLQIIASRIVYRGHPNAIDLAPDATLFGTMILAYLLDRNIPIAQIIPWPVNLIGWSLITAAVVLALYTISIIRSVNKTSNVTERPYSLITKGPYSRSRNPFYLAYVVIVIGLAVALGSMTAFVAPVICATILQLIIIPTEESILLNTFGKKYTDYQHLVRRWV